MRPFLLVSLLAYALVLAVSYARGGRFYTTFVAIILAIHTASAVALEPALAGYGRLTQVALYVGQAATYLYFARVARGASFSRPYRYLVAWPASWFVAGTFLGVPWAVAETLGFGSWLPWLPFAIAGFGFLQSITARRETKRILLDGEDKGALHRYDRRLRALLHRLGDHGRPLRVVQITDPHLGTFMSERRLRGICERAVAEAPDLILLTGDFLTLDTQRSPEPLARALAPLAAMRGQVFACFGNHDHECPELVKEALRRAEVELLLDRAVDVDVPWGKVQIVGADHRYREREAHLGALSMAYPRKPGRLRLWLLHDPGAFNSIPEGEADLVFSGHTHGGHLGLLSLGLSHTIVSAATKMPDHGVWARGRDRLYVHRGTGHYGFPLRVGVPAEESVLEIFLSGSAQPATP
jgi:predicted MPP superfamily phosphohydrolase